MWDLTLTQLKDELTKLYPEEQDYRAVVRESGLQESNIRFSGKATTDWSNIVDESLKTEKVLDVIDRALKGYSNNVTLLGIEQTIKSIVKANNNYITIMHAKDEVIRWYNTFSKANDDLAGQIRISPDQCDRTQQALNQLGRSLKEEYQLFVEAGSLRNILGPDHVALMRKLSDTNTQLDNLKRKMPSFKPICHTRSMISIRLQQTIQENMMGILNNIDDLMQVLQQLQYSGVKSKLFAVTNTRQNPSEFDASSQSKNKYILDDLLKADGKTLREAMVAFHPPPDKLSVLCNDISEALDDTDLEYGNLPGGTPQAKIMALINFCKGRHKYEDLIRFLIQNNIGFGNVLDQRIKMENRSF